MMSRQEIIAIYEQGPEGVIALVERLFAIIQQQQEQIEQLNARVKELEDRLALNSRNSSKPPSSNTPAQRPKSSRTPSGKKPGAQQGHPGRTLKYSPTPDRVVHHGAATCSGCGHNLSRTAGAETDDRRQVFDLPPLKLEVTEHRLLTKDCPRCGALNCGEFPAEIKLGAQYGPNLKALVVYCVNYHLLPWYQYCGHFSDEK